MISLALLQLAQNSIVFSANKAQNNFLSDIFSTIIEKLFQLLHREFSSDLLFRDNGHRIVSFELIKIFLLFVHVLDESSTTLSHLLQAIFKATAYSRFIRLGVHIGLVPDVMSDELLELVLGFERHRFFGLELTKRVHGPMHVLNQDVIAGYQGFWRFGFRFLYLLRLWLLLGCCRVLRLRDRSFGSLLSLRAWRFGLFPFDCLGGSGASG